MTPEQFRRIALDMPLATEGSHMGHADFRVKGKIFATLWPDGESGMVKLTPAEQRMFVRAKPGAFVPVKGAWGKRGCTQIVLGSADKKSLQRAIVAAWRNTAPDRLVADLGPTQDP